MLKSLFNPSNDMALAANLRQYLPPRRIQLMEEQLASLARFWDKGPWGWSLATKTRYRQMGYTEDQLPTDEWIALVRQLSSRETACHYIRQLLQEARADGQQDWLLGHEMHWVNQVEKPLPDELPLILKSPWSSSGRGIVIAEQWDETIQKRATQMVSSQGGYCADRFHIDKQQDLAMEFWVHSDHVEFLGYSVFETGERGAYSGNWVLSQEEMRAKIGIPEERLQWLIRYHQAHLGQWGYEGPVGIDMITTTRGVHPVIEINLRMNMGILALLLFQQGITADQPLTPAVDKGFQAVIRDSKLCILYN